MTQGEKAKRYDEALKAAIVASKDEDRHLKATLERIFPELKESEDERIRKELIEFFKIEHWDGDAPFSAESAKERVAWLEKQGDNNSVSPEEINKSIGRSIASSLINYLDDNRHEGVMNMSNIECEDLEKSILDSDWGKVYRYMQKKLEKQGERKSDWSEEDERICRCLIKDQNNGLDDVCKDRYGHSEIISDLKKIYRERINWLKSLKGRLS
jgi:hypothetical protein